jgi:hypothetical protein
MIYLHRESIDVTQAHAAHMNELPQAVCLAFAGASIWNTAARRTMRRFCLLRSSVLKIEHEAFPASRCNRGT